MQEKSVRQYIEPIWLGVRIYRCFISNLLGVKAPFFVGHKLTYNCNLRCKMCPFWKRTSADSSLEQEKAILKQVYNSGACGVAFEGGEPLLRRDLGDILAFSRSLPLHTSLITNGTLLESRINEIAPHINGVVYVSLDGLEKTHDAIRGADGSFRKAVRGIIAAKEKVAVTINTTVMAENIDEIESLIGLAKELGVKISVAIAHEYCNANLSSPATHKIPKIARKLIQMKREGFPIANSINYFKVMAKEKNWHCKPWTMINIDPHGNVVLPCYVHNDYASNIPLLECGIKRTISSFDWKKTKNCQKCNLHCYVESSLVLSKDISTFIYWAFKANI
ncbi:MAG: PTO1314 family radical SAM protein [Ignavibacteria bacterium]